MVRFYLKQKVFSIGDSYKFLTEAQELVFKAKGSIFAIPKRYKLYDANKNFIGMAKKSFWTYNYTISFGGVKVIKIRWKFAFMTAKYSIEYLDGSRHLELKGDFADFHYQVLEDGKLAAAISKKILSWGDTYEIDCDETLMKPALMALITIAIDDIYERRRKALNNNR
ncbi:MAG: hypothetical protein LBM03_00430 [Erysipelotrichaceae bacterium]|jgi:uncharacterized protein YxjI|nr:hypothetical protein [Erysipelotrichaceae bacterium]